MLKKFFTAALISLGVALVPSLASAHGCHHHHHHHHHDMDNGGKTDSGK